MKRIDTQGYGLMPIIMVLTLLTLMFVTADVYASKIAEDPCPRYYLDPDRGIPCTCQERQNQCVCVCENRD